MPKGGTQDPKLALRTILSQVWGHLMTERSSGPDTVDEQVGNNVKVKRAELGLSESHIANELGLTLDDYRDHESGMRRFSAGHLLKLTRLMNVSSEYFFEGLPVSRRGLIN
jgi:hypothetical protein